MISVSKIWENIDRHTKPEWVIHLHANGYPKDAPEYPFIESAVKPPDSSVGI